MGHGIPEAHRAVRPELGRFTAPPAARGLPEGTARKRRFAMAVGAINTTEHHTRPAIPIGTREPLKPTTVAAAEMTRVFLRSLEVEGRYERQWSRAWSVGEMEESRSIRRLANTRSSRCSRIVTARYGLECCRFFESPDVGCHRLEPTSRAVRSLSGSRSTFR